MPIWVTTPYFSAARVISSTSSKVRAMGFSTYTCLPCAIASIVIGKCEWSGTPTVTASIFSAIRSNITRKSWKRGAFGNIFITSCVCGAPMSTSHRATTSHRPVLYNSFAISPPRWPMPMKATRTLSFALTRGAPAGLAWAGIQNEGIADAAERASARFRNERREISSVFMIRLFLSLTSRSIRVVNIRRFPFILPAGRPFISRRAPI